MLLSLHSGEKRGHFEGSMTAFGGLLPVAVVVDGCFQGFEEVGDGGGDAHAASLNASHAPGPIVRLCGAAI